MRSKTPTNEQKSIKFNNRYNEEEQISLLHKNSNTPINNSRISVSNHSIITVNTGKIIESNNKNLTSLGSPKPVNMMKLLKNRAQTNSKQNQSLNMLSALTSPIANTATCCISKFLS